MIATKVSDSRRDRGETKSRQCQRALSGEGGGSLLQTNCTSVFCVLCFWPCLLYPWIFLQFKSKGGGGGCRGSRHTRTRARLFSHAWHKVVLQLWQIGAIEWRRGGEEKASQWSPFPILILAQTYLDLRPPENSVGHKEQRRYGMKALTKQPSLDSHDTICVGMHPLVVSAGFAFTFPYSFVLSQTPLQILSIAPLRNYQRTRRKQSFGSEIQISSPIRV